MSDTAMHISNRVMETHEEALWVEHMFAVANSLWSNGTCERMIREVVRALKALLQEEGRDFVRGWTREGGRLIARDTQAHRTTSCSGGRC